jgi:D-alanine transaminase
MKVFLNSEFMSRDEARISPDDRGFLFSDGAYEVIRSINGKLFRPEEHFSRLERSLRELRISGIEIESLKQIPEKLIAYNDLTDGDATVYIQITRGEAPRKHAFPDRRTAPTIYACASVFCPIREKFQKGVKIILVPDTRWSRCDIKSVALLPNILANQQAKESGAEEAVFVRNGTVTEGTHTNFCAVYGGELLTHPLSNRILGGITRNVVLDICREQNIPFREFPVFEGELRAAEEMMIVGTTTDVMPVVEVDGRRVKDGKPGPITRKLMEAFQKMVYRSR